MRLIGLLLAVSTVALAILPGPSGSSNGQVDLRY